MTLTEKHQKEHADLERKHSLEREQNYFDSAPASAIESQIKSLKTQVEDWKSAIATNNETIARYEIALTKKVKEEKK